MLCLSKGKLKPRFQSITIKLCSIYWISQHMLSSLSWLALFSLLGLDTEDLLWQRLLMLIKYPCSPSHFPDPLAIILDNVTKFWPMRSEQRWTTSRPDTWKHTRWLSTSLSPCHVTLENTGSRWHHCKVETTWIPGLLLRKECPGERPYPVRFWINENKLLFYEPVGISRFVSQHNIDYPSGLLSVVYRLAASADLGTY